MSSDRQIITDALVIGSGIAGATAAMRIADDPNVKVTVITLNKDPHESGTFYAQGGIIDRGPHDSAALLVEDLLRAGAYYNNPKAVRVLAEKGPQLLDRVLRKKLGVEFTERSGGEELEYIREAAHSTERILHVADATGRAIEEKVIAALRQYPNIELLTQHTAIDLLTPAHHSLDPLAIYAPRLGRGGVCARSENRPGVDLHCAIYGPGKRRPGANFPAHHQSGQQPGRWPLHGLPRWRARDQRRICTVPSHCLLRQRCGPFPGLRGRAGRGRQVGQRARRTIHAEIRPGMERPGAA